MKHGKTQKLTTAAICIALSYLLSYIKIFSMPTGGSVTAASMLPLMLYAWVFGTKEGMLAGAAYGLLQLIQRPQIIHIAQIVLDYPLAFSMLGLAGLFRKHNSKLALPIGTLLAGFGRFVCHTATGILFFGEYAPAADFLSVFIYSSVYNLGYLSVDTVFCTVVSALPPLQSALPKLFRYRNQ